MAAICRSLSGLIKALLLGDNFLTRKIQKCALKDSRFLRGNQEFLKPLMGSASSKGRKAPRNNLEVCLFGSNWLASIETGDFTHKSRTLHLNTTGLVITTANVSPPPKAKDKKSQSFFSRVNYSWGALQLLDTQIRQEHRVFTLAELT